MADPKIIYLTKSVHDLVKEYPELIPLMKELGFTRITEKTALNTLGRFMTIPKGAMMMHIDMGKVISTLLAHGFTLGGSFAQAPEEKAAPSEETAPDERTARITEYIRRLSAGEDLEKVRADFVKHFKDVDPGEIALAEQSLLKGGVPLRDVQRLCDVHSALFHGTTRAEKIAAAEAKVQESLGRRSPAALERKDGADEIDMVIHIGALKEGNLSYVTDEIRQVKEAAGSHILKVIVETCYLTEEEKIAACHAVTEGGGDFIKTSTGFGSAGASLSDVKLFKKYVGPKVKIKAAGGIHSKKEMEDFLQSGASRIGASGAIPALLGKSI